ncbi:MAG: heavy metal translocating P-type ATPase [Nocardioides sp.]
MSVQVPDLDLDISGMTCAACANRIERKLNKLPGVVATVNYATEKARVTVPATMAGQQVLDAVASAGYAARLHETARPEESDSATALRRRLLLAMMLSVPVIALSMVPGWQFTGWQWVALALTTPVATWAAWPFHRAAAINLRHGGTTMDTLVSVGVLAAYGWSVLAMLVGPAGELGHAHTMSVIPGRTIGGEHGTSHNPLSNIYLEAAAGVTTFMLLGRWLERRAKRRAGVAFRALLALAAKEVTVLESHPGAETVEVRRPASALRVGDRFRVRPGEKIATDGLVVAGTSAVDLALVTGEPVPVDVGPGDALVGGALNTSGVLDIEASRVGEQTHLAQLARLVEQAQQGKAQVQRLADRISSRFVPIVIGLSVLTFLAWWSFDRDLAKAFAAGVAVLIVACPCALGLATPTALLVGTGRGAQLGIIIKGPEVLESTKRIDTVLLDKTGTVTTGRMRLVSAVAEGSAHGAENVTEDEVRRVAASLEAGSEHPIAQAIVAGWDGPRSALTGFVNEPGVGVRGLVEDARGGVEAYAGKPSYLVERGLSVSAELRDGFQAAQEAGHTPVAVGWDGRVRGVLVVADTVKPSSARAVTELRRLGLHPILLTGDNERAAQTVASQVGIDEVRAEVPPAGKAAVIRDLQSRGRVVAMVGDGVNDAAALAQADLGLAMGAGADAAIEASDLTIVRGDLRLAADAVRLSRRTLAVIKGNLFWAFAYNVAAIPVAAAGLLTPMLAGLAMAFSSVFVVSNSLRLRHFR